MSRVEEGLDMLENKVSIAPRQVADTFVVLHGLECTAVVDLRGLLSEEPCQCILLCKLANLGACELEEDL